MQKPQSKSKKKPAKKPQAVTATARQWNDEDDERYLLDEGWDEEPDPPDLVEILDRLQKGIKPF